MRGTDFTQPPSGRPADGAAAEQARLDQAIERADDLLLTSLRSDEQRRVRRRRNLFFLGGLAMTVSACALIGVSILLSHAAPADESGQLTQQGWQLWQQREYDQAATKFEEAVKLAPKNTAAWNGLGWSRFNSGKRDAAKKAFQKVIALEPKHPAALNGLGQLALARRDYQEAEKYLLKAAPQAPAAWYGLARLYLLEGKYDQAKKWAKKLVDSGEADDSAKQMLQAAEAKRLDPELRKQIEPPPADDQTSSNVMRGWKFFNQGRATEAKEIFAAVLATNPDSGAALNGMGWCLLSSGEAAEAKPYFEKVIALDPQAAGAMNGMARVLMSQGDAAGSIRIWKEMVERFPGPHAGTSGLADAYLEAGDFKQALPLLEELAQAMPADQDVARKLARAKEHTGQ
jgi:Flp pilus assembly protein TadD